MRKPLTGGTTKIGFHPGIFRALSGEYRTLNHDGDMSESGGGSE
jgi:hypothetical protein